MIVYCTGTSTGVGKTWVGAAVLHALRDGGVQVAARKPVQSYDPLDGEPTDAEVLAAATGEAVDDVCQPGRSLAVAMAPPMAAAVLGVAVPTVAELVASLAWPEATTAVRWVEGVGGPRSPVGADGDGVDLCRALGPDVVVLVADAGLGTINAVELARAALFEAGPEPVVVLNRYDDADDLHRRNRAWLAEHLGRSVTTSVSELARDIGAMAPISTPRTDGQPGLGAMDFSSR